MTDGRDHPNRRVGDKHPIRTRIDTWQFFAIVGGAILAGILIFTVITYRNEGSDRAARKASAEAQYQECVGSIPLLGKFERFITGVRQVGNVLLLNSIQMHNITPPGSKVYRQQRINIERLRRALRKQRHVDVPALTVADCRAQHPRQ